jgi:hypothetical protein
MRPAAAASEDHQGGSVPAAKRGPAGGDGRRGGRGGPLGRLPGRWHGGVNRLRGRPGRRLRPGDEHAAARWSTL